MDKNRRYQPIRWFLICFTSSTAVFWLAIFSIVIVVDHFGMRESNFYEWVKVAALLYMPVSALFIFVVICACGGIIAHLMIAITTAAFYVAGNEIQELKWVAMLWVMIALPVLIFMYLAKILRSFYENNIGLRYLHINFLNDSSFEEDSDIDSYDYGQELADRMFKGLISGTEEYQTNMFGQRPPNYDGSPWDGTN